MIQAVKNWYHWVAARAWRVLYGWPDRGLRLFGVTGTNGKTTTCYLLASILREQRGRGRVGMLTTVALWIGEREVVNETKMTTLPSRALFRYLRQMRDAGVTDVVLEVTSHALDQHRLAGLRLAGGVILNLTREHLDYHRTMARYRQAKARLVSYLAPGAPLVGKADDQQVALVLAAARQRGVPVHAFTRSQASRQTTGLEGAVNQENALAARLLAEAVGVPERAIAAGMAAVRQVPGRMEWLRGSNGANAVIDYAVTPEALARLYQHVRGQTKGRIIGVLGAAGRRDRGKRPAMARAVAELADELIITEEDPWTEDPGQIFRDLERGLIQRKGLRARWRRIPDRREALRYALQTARPGDTIVATGKGAERGLAVGRQIVPWHERSVIEELWGAMGVTVQPQ